MRRQISHFLFLSLLSFAAGLIFVPLGLLADDTSLFRQQSGKPFVYVILDTSTSMNLAPGSNAWVPANGDDAGSKIRQIKEAMLEVFPEAGDQVFWGFANYNQDNLRVRGKHWLYRVRSLNPVGGLGIGYPVAGDVLTFGKHFELGAGTVNGEGGSCTAPLPMGNAADLQKIHRFAKLNPKDPDNDGNADDGAAGYDPTVLWVTKNNKTYRLEVTWLEGNYHGNGDMKVKFTSRQVTGCPASFGAVESVDVTISYVTEFLMSDENATDSTVIDQCGAGDIAVAAAAGGGGGGGGGGATQKKTEKTGGVGWTWQDMTAINTCGSNGSTHPFSGNGWEGNYDGAVKPAGSPFDAIGNRDAVSATETYTVKQTTTLDATQRTRDRGDMLPLHWDENNQEAMFRRLAPNWSSGKPLSELEVRAAPFYKDVPNAAGFLELRDTDIKPLIAYGASPLNKAVVDFRCFYGGNSDNKCKDDLQPYGEGWAKVAEQEDWDEWGCRQPFLIVIGDGESHGDSNSATSTVSDLKGYRIKTWAIDYGGSCPNNGTYKSLTTAGKGECLTPQTKEDLIGALRKIVGEIQQSVRSFASAAVPTVQADVADKVFLSNFTPLKSRTDASVPLWPGQMNAFLKPIPLTADERPDTSVTARCPSPDTNASACFLWDAGKQMMTQVQVEATTPFTSIAGQYGSGENQRRVYYSQLPPLGNSNPSGEWPTRRRYLLPRTYSDGNTAQRWDLWRALGYTSFSLFEANASTNATTENNVNEVVRDIVAKKYYDLEPETPNSAGDDVAFILGDIFHSNPVVVGSPANSLYYAKNLDNYRTFADKHAKRRKLLLVGANDGMLHAFDAGVWVNSQNRFNNGTGKELFAWIPRSVMPTLADLYEGSGRDRRWSVDGNITVADVFVDPVYPSASGPTPAERQWRTVVIGGLREGGTGFYAIDVTQPDKVNTSTGVPTVGAGNYVPSCMADEDGYSVGSPDSDCGPVAFPSQLWEFRDGIYSSFLGRFVPLDEDTNGADDLTASWSTPNIGRIQVVSTKADGSDDKIVDKYVAIFGGGLDRSNGSGNYLYMVDIETGKAIYKFPLRGSAPAEPAAVDTDQDGYLDRIYIGTLNGFLYRVDLRGPEPARELPRLRKQTVRASSGGFDFDEELVRITNTMFAPRIIFKARATPAVPPNDVPVNQPVYYRPSVIYIASLNKYAIAFGTGDRENLWSNVNTNGRFYVFRDDIAIGDTTSYYTETDLQMITPTTTTAVPDYVTVTGGTKRGWFLDLSAGERLITNPFALSGILVFTVYDPNVRVTGGSNNTDPVCSRTGDSRIFAVNATNGNGLLVDLSGAASRYRLITDFVTDPYTEQAATKNPAIAGDGRKHGDQIPVGSRLDQVQQQLKKMFPANCKFGSYRIDVKTLASDTGVVFIAPVPVCIIEKNWKEY